MKKVVSRPTTLEFNAALNRFMKDSYSGVHKNLSVVQRLLIACAFANLASYTIIPEMAPYIVKQTDLKEHDIDVLYREWEADGRGPERTLSLYALSRYNTD